MSRLLETPGPVDHHLPRSSTAMSEEASGAVLDAKPEKPLVTFEGESEANRIVQELMSFVASVAPCFTA